MSEARVAARYATSLFDLAKEENILNEVMEDAKSFLEYCHASRKLELMLQSPIVHKETKWKVLKRLFENGFQKTTIAFIRIVLRKNRELILKEIFSQFEELFREEKGIVLATVYTAMPVSDEIRENVNQFLISQTHKTVQLSTSVTPDLIGGFVLRYEDKLIDASVSTQLKTLRQHLIKNN